MKKAFSFLIALLLLCLLCACKDENTDNKQQRLSVVTVLFAEYDFANHISGGLADVTMLLPPGSESHSYDPTPQDIIAIKNADIFVCGGGESDSWIDVILDSLDETGAEVIKMTDICQLKEEETVDGMQAEKGEDDEEVEYDEHVWTSPKNALLIIDEIEKTMCLKDAENAPLYHENALNYKTEIEKLDNDIRKVCAEAQRNELVFADRFPFRYFTDEYSLKYYAAFPGCSSEAEPSAKTVKFLIDKVREDNIPAVLTIEFSNQAIAYAVKEETGAKILRFHSCHNVTKEQFAEGVTYVSLMRSNLESLKEAIG